MRFTPKNFHWQVETWVTARDWEHAREKFKARKIPMAKNTLLEIWGGVKKASETNTILKRSGKPQMQIRLDRCRFCDIIDSLKQNKEKRK